MKRGCQWQPLFIYRKTVDYFRHRPSQFFLFSVYEEPVDHFDGMDGGIVYK